MERKKSSTLMFDADGNVVAFDTSVDTKGKAWPSGVVRVVISSSPEWRPEEPPKPSLFSKLFRRLLP